MERIPNITIKSHERETYPWFKKYYEKRGYHYQRIEGSPSVPDIHLGKGENYFWLEVKMYRGTKKLEDVVVEDLKFQPGQLRFRYDVRLRCVESAYRLAIVNKAGFVKII